MIAGPGAIAEPRRRERVSRRVWLLLALAVAGVAAAGLWGITASRGEEGAPVHAEVATVGDLVPVPGGLLRVDAVEDSSLTHVMPGMDFYGQQQPGHRRITVRVSLFASGEQGLSFPVRSFVLSGDGTKPLTPVGSDFGSAFAPEGTRVSGSLVYQVPEQVDRLVLSFPRAEQGIELPLGPQQAAEPRHD